MPKSTDDLVRLITGRDFDLIRFDAHLRRLTLRELVVLEDKIAREILLTTVSQSRLQNLSAVTSMIERLAPEVSSHIGKASAQVTREVLELAQDEAAWMGRILERELVGMTSTEAAELLRAGNLAGVSIPEQWQRFSGVYAQRVGDTLKRSVYENLGKEAMLQEFLGTQRRSFRDGVAFRLREQASGLVQGTIRAAASESRGWVYGKLPDVVGLQAVAVLDSRTSDICRARSGAVWSKATGRPLKQSPYRGRFPGNPPWHHGCRTTLVPILRGERSARDLTFDAWISEQSPEAAREILGPGKYALWAKGRITMRDLINQRGRPLTLTELRERYR